MPVPDFIRGLREKVGTEPLWLLGVSAVVLRDGELLLARRADNRALVDRLRNRRAGRAPRGRRDPRSARETGVTAEVERLAAVSITYPNGDRSQFTAPTFRCRWVAGQGTVGDDESLEVGWFRTDALPDVDAASRRRVERALSADPAPALGLDPV